MTHESGQGLLHYRLVEQIGQGGMGAVWLAVDTTLDREAAIKILPQGLGNDPQLLARFEREAKVLASLSHPNLASVFGVHETDGTHFLAMELVPGEDLARRLAQGPLLVDEALRVASGIAEALQAAHEKGVVHRDLKPANVMLTPAGHVKVLDFGLAKIADPENEMDSSLTATGVVLGTAPYMSPEQARGQPVDTRSDIWSFGCVLWECLTGARPFAGATFSDQLAAILNNDPDWSALPPGTPPAVRRVLRRCLSKSKDTRMHHIADVRLELIEAADEPAHEPAPYALKLPRGRALPLAAVVILAAGAGYLAGRDREPEVAAPVVRETLLSTATFDKLTNFPGDELGAAISPDGNFVGFLGDQSGKFEAYLGSIESAGVFENLSGRGEDAAVKAPLARVRRLGIVADGSGVWLGGVPGQPVRVVPLVGARVRPWLPEGVIHVDWAPGGKQILYSQSTGGDPVFVADADGSNPREVLRGTHEGHHQHFPTWSADGKWIYVVRGRVRFGDMDLWRVRPDGNDLKQLTFDKRDVRFPTSLDERTLLFVARELDGSGPWLWEFDVESGTTRRAATGVERYTSIAASRNGRKLVATVANPVWNIVTVPIPAKGSVSTEADVKPHPLKAVRALAPRIHKDRLYYLSSHGGTDGLWRYHNESVEEIWSGAPLLEPAAISPNGERIALVVREGAQARLHIIKSNGTLPRRLVDSVDVRGSACWSPNGDWIAFGGIQDGRDGLFKVRVSDGEVRQILWLEVMNPVWSPDGALILCEGPHVALGARLVAVTPEGKVVESWPELFVRPFGERLRFLPDGSGLIYMKGVNPTQEFYRLDLKTMASRKLTELGDRWSMRSFDITPDGKTIVFDRVRANADVVLIDRDGRK